MCTTPISSAASLSKQELTTGQGTDDWNFTLSNDSTTYEYDAEVWATAQGQVEKGLLSTFMSKNSMDRLLGTGRWRAIKRRKFAAR